MEWSGVKWNGVDEFGGEGGDGLVNTSLAALARVCWVAWFADESATQ